VRRSVLVMSMLVALAGPLAACKSETPGLPGPQNTTTKSGGGGPFTDPNTSSGPTSGSSSGTLGPLAKTSACALLTESDVAPLGASGPGVEDDRLPRTRDCEYTKSGSFKLGITIYDDLGIKDVQDFGNPKTMTVGKHDAIQGEDPGGACAVAMKTTETSRVDAVATANGDVKKACDLALSLAQVVEKKLP